MLAGTVEHGDSLGNKGDLGAGDVQWMTAGRGIMHQEMPKGDAEGRMHGFQLWANLPSSLKMTEPRYQDVTSNEIPVVTEDDGTSARIICGEFWGKRGPGRRHSGRTPVSGHSCARRSEEAPSRSTPTNRPLPYVFEGSGTFEGASDPFGVLTEKEFGGEEIKIRDQTGDRTLVIFGTGDEIVVQAGDEGIRFLLVSGAPIKEPVAWHGPIVMNTRDELVQAVTELQNGTFIR